MRKSRLLMRPLMVVMMMGTPFFAAPLQAAPARSNIDPSIGSYYYFAALSQRCGTVTPARAAALDQYKGQFIKMLRKSVEMMGPASAKNAPDLAKFNQRIASLEQQGPSTADLAPFVAQFAKAKPAEIAGLCAHFDSSMSERMALNEMIYNPPAEELPKAKDGSIVPPIRLLSVQHLHALMVSCEKVDPDAGRIAARAAAFEQAIPKVRTPSGVYRTEVGVDGKYKETKFPSAAVMVKSPEFEVDAKRYLEVVARSSPSVLKNDCAGFVEIMDTVGK